MGRKSKSKAEKDEKRRIRQHRYYERHKKTISVAHRPDVKSKKREWWNKLRQNSPAYAEFCKNRAIKLAEKRYGNFAYAKDYEIISD